MNIALINGSPKPKKTDSASGELLKHLKSMFPPQHKVKDFTFNKSTITEAEIKELHDFPVWVFAFPLYIDSIPSHLLSCLCQIEKNAPIGKTIHIYAIVPCGFYEGAQTRNALSIMECWCIKAGLRWGMGIGYGGGGGLTDMKAIPLGKGMKKSLGRAYSVFSDVILSQSSKENICTSISYPKFLCPIFVAMEWKRRIKANGGRTKDLDKRL